MSGEKYLTADQAKDFVARHPSLQWIDIFMFDLNGIARGKRIRPTDLASFAAKTSCSRRPSTSWMREEHVPRKPAGFGRRAILTSRSASSRTHWRRSRSTASTHAQAVMVPTGDGDGLDPGRILEKQVAALAKAGQHAVTAVELEFYVSKANPEGQFTLADAEGLGGESGLAAALSVRGAERRWPIYRQHLQNRRGAEAARRRRAAGSGAGPVRNQPEAQERPAWARRSMACSRSGP